MERCLETAWEEQDEERQALFYYLSERYYNQRMAGVIKKRNIDPSAEHDSLKRQKRSGEKEGEENPHPSLQRRLSRSASVTKSSAVSEVPTYGAFAILEGKYLDTQDPFKCYITRLPAIMGRHHKNYATVDGFVNLGHCKTISKIHMVLDYDFVGRSFTVEVKGKNGCLVNGVPHHKGDIVRVPPKAALKIGQLGVYFLPATSARPNHTYAELVRQMFLAIGPGNPLSMVNIADMLCRKYRYFEEQGKAVLQKSINNNVIRKVDFVKVGTSGRRYVYLLADDNSELARRFRETQQELEFDQDELDEKANKVVLRSVS